MNQSTTRGSTRTAAQRIAVARFDELVRSMPPQAISDDVRYENTVEMIDRLMTIDRLTKGQAVYMETLVQLVEAYESERHAVETADLGGLEN